MALADDEEWSSSLTFVPMTVLVARDIADTWKYPQPYDFYDATADPEDYQEFVTPAEWPGYFFQVRSRGDLIGFFAGSPRGHTCEIFLGLHPELTGSGLGLAFLRAGLAHLDSLVNCKFQITLDVAEFNQRAIRVYGRAGFTVTRHFNEDTNGSTFPFVAMALSASCRPATR